MISSDRHCRFNTLTASIEIVTIGNILAGTVLALESLLDGDSFKQTRAGGGNPPATAAGGLRFGRPVLVVRLVRIVSQLGLRVIYGTVAHLAAPLAGLVRAALDE